MLRAYLWGIETLDTICYFLWCYSCEPTYEELKLFKGYFAFSLIVSCEPTYEELKQKSTPLEFVNLFKLRAYLWGIETLSLL